MPGLLLNESLPILTRTPVVLDLLLRGLSEDWTNATEGPATWSPFTVLGHLIHAEKADWIPRIQIILEHGTARAFDPFDREAQFRDSQGKSLDNLLDEFTAARKDSLAQLRALNLNEEQFAMQGTHPVLGPVTIHNLLATWTAHDLAHLLQISRVMAKRYKTDVGPFTQFLSVMK
jgi:hypothetical protein